MVPKDRIGVEFCRRVEPKIHSLLAIAIPSRKYVGLDRVWLPRSVPQELEVQLVASLISVGIQLQTMIKAQ